MPLRDFIDKQYLRYVGHICRLDNFCLAKVMLFTEPKRRHYRDPWIKISKLLGISIEQSKKMTQSRAEFAGLINQDQPTIQSTSTTKSSLNEDSTSTSKLRGGGPSRKIFRTYI